MNKAFLIGRLTKDPELKFTQGAGVATTTFGIAVDRNFTGADGKKEVDFLNIVTWKKLAEHVANNLSKGRLVAVSGRIQVRNYQAQDGKKVYITEIVADEVKFLDWPKDGQANNSNDGFTEVNESDDLPF